MYNPTTRVLTVLEMLQSRERVTGSEIAARLEVHIRTVRRYISMLEELGIPLAAERGRYGAYRLLPGYKLPPLMFTDGEALALILGLLAVKKLGLVGTAPGMEGALAKLERVIPTALREKVRVLGKTLILDLHAGKGEAISDIIMVLSMAAGNQQRVFIRYASARGRWIGTDLRSVWVSLSPLTMVYRRALPFTRRFAVISARPDCRS